MVGHQVLLSVPAVEILGTEGDPSTGVSLRLWWIVQPSFDRTRGCQIPIVRSLVQEFCLKGGFRFDRGHVLALHGALQSSSCDHALQLCESGGSATELSVTDAWGRASAGDAMKVGAVRTNGESILPVRQTETHSSTSTQFGTSICRLCRTKKDAKRAANYSSPPFLLGLLLLLRGRRGRGIKYPRLLTAGVAAVHRLTGHADPGGEHHCLAATAASGGRIHG
jgi:hypothetical protein